MRLHRFVRELYRIGWQYAFAYLPGKCRTAAACKYAAWSEGAGNGPELGIELGLEPNVIYLLVIVGKIRIIYLWGHHRLFSPATKETRPSVAEINTNGLKANSEKRSYSVMEVAEILGVSKKSVYNMCANGTFKCVRIGTRLRISKKAFDDWLDGRDNTWKETWDI